MSPGTRAPSRRGSALSSLDSAFLLVASIAFLNGLLLVGGYEVLRLPTPRASNDNLELGHVHYPVSDWLWQVGAALLAVAVVVVAVWWILPSAVSRGEGQLRQWFAQVLGASVALSWVAMLVAGWSSPNAVIIVFTVPVCALACWWICTRLLRS